MNTTLHRLSANKVTVGGVLFTFPSGLRKTASWESATQVRDSLALAADLTAKVRQSLMDAGQQDDLDRTNWVSCVAGCKKHIEDWNLALGAQ